MPGATAMTFDSLQQSIKDALERGGRSDALFLRELPKLINRNERSLANRLKIQGYRDVLTGEMTAGQWVVPKPDGWRNTVTFTIGGGEDFEDRKVLRPRSYEYLQLIAPNRAATGQPQWYTDYNLGNWFVATTPDRNYPFEIIVYRLPSLLSDDNQQNYLTQYLPNALLFSCLVNLEPFLKDDSRLLVWKQLFADELASIDAEEIAKIVDRGQTRTSV
jgi:hypothetical protein